ncbi:sulfotransferase 1C4-like [Leptidea sinapis]|uniref:sulfotransferase 1C4-like n=1 Tax=Leptidea sinapis TaxID=189913 RepID=UPI002122BD25|nr:sulfotransferase 1C4-like [Leptidea sinapis]
MKITGDNGLLQTCLFCFYIYCTNLVFYVLYKLNLYLLTLTTGVKQNHVQVGPSKYYYPDIYRELGPKYYNFAIRPNDVFLISHPRSGSTWTQEMVWLINNDLNYETAKSIDVSRRFPLMDLNLVVRVEKSRIEQIQEEETREHISSIVETVFEDLSLSTSQRFIKTHLPFSLLPPDLPETAKVVYIARDPRDVFVSLHHILIHRFYFDRPDELWNLYRRGLIPWGPIFPHIKEGWAARHHPNVYFIFYEDVVTDLPGSLRRMANFFGKTFTNEQIEKLAEHLRFDNFKDNDSVNQQKTMTELGVCNEQSRFIRKGKIGEWRHHFNEQQKQEVEEWMRENLADTDIKFPIYN